MKTTAALAGNAHAGTTTRDADAGNAASGFRLDSWDPRQVWLTRIRQPRDHAIERASRGQRDTDEAGDDPGCERNSWLPGRG